MLQTEVVQGLYETCVKCYHVFLNFFLLSRKISWNPVEVEYENISYDEAQVFNTATYGIISSLE